MAIGGDAVGRDAWKVVGALHALNASTSTGAGTAFKLGGAFEKFAVQHLVKGSTVEGSIQLQGRIGGSTGFVALGSAIAPSTVGAIVVASSTVPVTEVRVNVATVSGSTGGISAWVAVL